jgi:hypothetical protein
MVSPPGTPEGVDNHTARSIEFFFRYVTLFKATISLKTVQAGEYYLNILALRELGLTLRENVNSAQEGTLSFRVQI